MRAGFIGLGKMGRPMALNMLKAGFPLTVANRSQGVVADVASHGATAAKSPAEVAANADLIALCLPMPAHVEEVVLGPNGVIEGIRPGSIVIDFSTIGPSTCRHVAERLAEKGAHYEGQLRPDVLCQPPAQGRHLGRRGRTGAARTSPVERTGPADLRGGARRRSRRGRHRRGDPAPRGTFRHVRPRPLIISADRWASSPGGSSSFSEPPPSHDRRGPQPAGRSLAPGVSCASPTSP
ncbi:MAG: hypothetical protein EBU40_02455 [Proteobacteria bacterium]|nr:hypothetical protein [Pseudomonadota bacterium]